MFDILASWQLMTRSIVWVAAILAAPVAVWGQLPSAYVSRLGQIVRLDDLNADGDYFDFGESALFAADLPSTITSLAATADGVFVLDPPAAAIYQARDVNEDGDALDFGELTLFGQLSSGMPPPTLTGLAAAEGRLFAIDVAAETLIRFADMNGDLDALDFGESASVGQGLSGASAMAFRPDGRLLVARQSASVPVLILDDRNSDGDFLDFAEAISYAENISPGTHITSPHDHVSYLLRPAAGQIIRLQDLTGDDDALDFGEIVVFADGMSSPSVLAADRDERVLVAAADAFGTILWVSDLNRDGDALDVGEVTTVGQGINQAAGIVVLSTGTSCIRGDLDESGTVELNDVSLFVDALLGLSAAPLCRADVNIDGQVNGLDVASFTTMLVP
jgi:hypothetical protein